MDLILVFVHVIASESAVVLGFDGEGCFHFVGVHANVESPRREEPATDVMRPNDLAKRARIWYGEQVERFGTLLELSKTGEKTVKDISRILSGLVHHGHIVVDIPVMSDGVNYAAFLKSAAQHISIVGAGLH